MGQWGRENRSLSQTSREDIIQTLQNFPLASTQKCLSSGRRRKRLDQSPKQYVMHDDQETQQGQDGRAGILLTCGLCREKE